MNTKNEVKIEFLSRSANENFSRVAVSAFFAQLDPTVDEISDIKTAVSEAVTNCIVHGYKNTMGKIYIILRVLDGNKAYIKIKDKGCGIDDIKKAMEPLFTTAAEEDRAGLGFAVMQSFMDKVRVTSKKDKGTTVTMVKKLNGRDLS
ncbi:MAG: anti-sigma F factor [Oscillospiraceae bacterium]